MALIVEPGRAGPRRARNVRELLCIFAASVLATACTAGTPAPAGGGDALTSGDPTAAGDGAEPTDEGPCGGDDGAASVTLERWSPGTTAFREATSEWGLDAIGVEGFRLATADVDNDGFPDLIVRRGGLRSDDFGPGGTRHFWLLRNTGAGRFEDITAASGILARRTDPGGTTGRPAEVVAFADVDNDGDLDAFTGSTTTDPVASLGETSELMLNQGGGTFVLGPEDSPLRRAGFEDAVAGASFADVDLDGKIDLWVTEFDLQDRLYKGDGAGGFTDVTEDRGLRTLPWQSIADLNAALGHSRAWGAAACDLNGDGRPELLTPSYGRAPNHLWQASSGGALFYVNRSIASGYAFDDNFTWQDNEYARCFCQDNPTAEDCPGVPPPLLTCSQMNWNHDQDREPFRLGGNSAATSCADLDNDGRIDLVTGEIKHWWAGSGADGSEVLLNTTAAADVTFTRPGDEATGLAIPHPSSFWDEGHMTQAVFDFDNDGLLDLYQGASDYAGNHGRLYHQVRSTPLLFEEVPVSDGIDHHRSHGVTVADFDRDGDLDVVVGHSRNRCDATEPDDCYPTAQVRLFENVIGARNNWVQLTLKGTLPTNAAAIGARVTATAGGITQTREIGGGYGHYGAQDDLTVHFGIGEATSAEIHIRWPNAALNPQTFTAQARRRYDVVRGELPVVSGCR